MLTLIDTTNSSFKFGANHYRSEVVLLASSLSEHLDSADDEYAESAFAYLYDAITSSPWLIYSMGILGVLVYSESAYPQCLSVRDASIWCLMADVATEVSPSTREDILESLDMLHDDFFTRNGYRNMLNGYGGR